MLSEYLPMETRIVLLVALITLSVWSGRMTVQRGEGMSVLIVIETICSSNVAQMPAAGCMA